MRRLAVLVCGLGVVTGLAGCTHDPGPDPTVPPVAPVHRAGGSVLPYRVAGYTAAGSTPAPQQLTATYISDTAPLDIAVVTFDPTGGMGTVTLSGQQWYGPSRCGILWSSGGTPGVQQAACITVLTDGVMTTVAGGTQTPDNLATLANAINDLLE